MTWENVFWQALQILCRCLSLHLNCTVNWTIWLSYFCFVLHFQQMLQISYCSWTHWFSELIRKKVWPCWINFNCMTDSKYIYWSSMAVVWRWKVDGLTQNECREGCCSASYKEKNCPPLGWMRHLKSLFLSCLCQ